MIMHHEKQLAFWRSVKQSLVAAAENPTGAQVERIEQAPASVAAATIAAPTTPQAAVKAVSPVHGKPPSKPGKPAKFNPAPVGGGGGATPKAVVKKPPAPSEPSPASPASGGKKPGHKPPPPPARGGGLRGGPATGRKPPTPSSSAGGKFRPVQGTSMARKPPAKVDTSPPQEPDVADLPDVPESPTSPKSPPAKKVGSKNAQLMAKLFGGGSNPLAGMAGGKPPGGFKKKKASSGGDSSSALGTRTGRAATAAARPSTQLQRATCVLDYRPTMTGHLALRSGDVVTVLDRSGPEWHVTYQGQQGLVPKTYLEIVGVGGTGGPPKSVDDTAKPRNATRRTNSGGAAAARGPPGGVPMVMPTGGLSALKKGASPANALAAAAAARAAKATAGTRQSRGSIIDGPSSHDDAKPTVPKRKAKQAGDSFVKTVYDYSSDDPNDLHFDEDEIIRVTAPDNEGWTSGELLGKVGVFPSNYVEPVDAAVVALAEYDYETEDDGFLSFPDNVFLIIHDRSDDSWWEAEYKGQKGLVPANYMKVVKE